MNSRGQLVDRLLIDGFLAAVNTYPDRPALDVEGQIFSYAQLAREAGTIASAIIDCRNDSPLVGVLANNSLTGYAGILGTLISGRAYVPLHPHHPVDRLRRSIETAELDIVIAGTESVTRLLDLLPEIKRPITIIAPAVEDVSYLQPKRTRHRIVGQIACSTLNATVGRPTATADDLAYLIFTSGSTGDPKGVPVRNRNVVPFVNYMSRQSEAGPDDRFIQLSDLTFDLSIFPIWTCWENGACLICADQKTRLAPATFVQKKKISIWTSVPSVIVLLKRLRLLKQGVFPSIRYSFICGEPLLSESARSWQAACPKSIVDNMYGPTEASCAFTQFRWTGDDSRCMDGVVPIGWPFDTQHAALLSQNLEPVSVGVEGELCLSGTQVVSGYFKNPEKTKEKFVVIPELGEDIWYRTGDLAVREEDGCYFFRGRTDYQVKVFGHRIELQEVERALRDATDSEMVVCMPWPVVDGAPQGLVGFVGGAKQGSNEASVLQYCESMVPDYMIPKNIHFFSTLPLNANGKIDRTELLSLLQEGSLKR